MKLLLVVLAIACMAAVAYWRSRGRAPSDDRPLPDLKTGREALGVLVVESIAVTSPYPKGGAPVLYTVDDENGARVARASTPSTSLPAGRYRIHVEQPGAELKGFWVTIEPGRTTRVDLREVRD